MNTQGLPVFSDISGQFSRDYISADDADRGREMGPVWLLLGTVSEGRSDWYPQLTY